MNAQRSDKTKWQHPIPNSLIRNYKDEVGILDIIDLEVESLFKNLRESNAKIFSVGDVCTPIEKIVQALNVDVTTFKHSKALGITKYVGAKMQVAINSTTQHYFRHRFTLAHELGHICLSQVAGPFTYHELAQTENSNHEEEFLCDLFAAAILMPKSTMGQYLEGDSEISLSTINRIARAFKVSKSAVLRRLACLKKSLLLFWSETENPLTEGSDKALRITSVYPNLHQLSTYFIPLYCTANEERFEPNIILESLEKEISISRSVLIRDLGSLPEGYYTMHNIFFRRWSKELYYPEQNIRSQRLYDMSTLIELNTPG
jgi:Zn-dependent peptidase ImmA (M78 family)